MSSTNGRGPTSGRGQNAQVVAAERIARAVVLAFDVCEQLRAPLSSVQKVALLQAAILEFDGFEARLRSLEEVSRLLYEVDGR